MQIHVIDVETTGLDPEKDRVVEIACVPITFVEDHLTRLWRLEIGDARATLVDPQMPIPPSASGVHHIIDADVKGMPWLGNAISEVTDSQYGEAVEIVAAHNARFDREFVPPLRQKRWLDTYRCAMHVWPDAPDYKNGTLFYWLGQPRLDDLIEAGLATHRAIFDAHMTARILIRLLAERTLEDLLKLSTKAVVLKTVGFGKHFGQLWTEVPFSYLEWASGQDFDPDVKFTVKHEMRRRKELSPA